MTKINQYSPKLKAVLLSGAMLLATSFSAVAQQEVAPDHFGEPQAQVAQQQAKTVKSQKQTVAKKTNSNKKQNNTYLDKTTSGPDGQAKLIAAK